MPDARKRPLAAAVLVAIGTIVSTDVPADSVIVDRCDDSGPGGGATLRQAIALASDNDDVDLSGLQCSTITLQQGELVVEQNTLGLLGPSDHELSIDAHNDSRAIDHLGTGTLYLTYVGVAYGTVGVPESGGCIRSSGTVDLLHSPVSHCSAAKSGGGAYAYSLKLAYSRVSGNSATDGGGLAATFVNIEHGELTSNHANYSGGGVKAAYAVTISDSMVGGNTAGGNGGGAHSAFKMYLTRDTINGNAATGYGGGVFTTIRKFPRSLLKITDSTIDNNFSGYRGGGVYGGADTDIVGSTISANTAGIENGIFSGQGGGVFAYDMSIKNSTVVRNTDLRPGGAGVGGITGRSATVISSILANNTSGSTYSDLRVFLGLTAYTSVIRSSAPPSVSLTVDPRLGPLADHGGGRRTHAVLPGSPVVDLGSNPLGLQHDERGLPRVVGSNPDIGAYERQAVDDQLFYDGFESS